MTIINKPELKPFRQKVAETGIMAGGTLLLATATMVLWMIALSWGGMMLFGADIRHPTLQMLIWLTEFAAFSYIAIVSWAKYNLFRYGKRNRRKSLPPATPAMAAEHFATTENHLACAGKAKIAWVEVRDGQQTVCTGKLRFTIKNG